MCVVWVVSLCVSPCEVTELFRVDGSGSGDGDKEFFLPTIHKHGKQLFQRPLLVYVLTFPFRDNNTNHLWKPTMCRSFIYFILLTITAT